MAKKPHLRLVPPRRPVAVNPCEWIGGRIPTSIRVAELGGNIGPEVVMWIELPSGLVLRSQLVPPGENPDALREVLLGLFEHPENETPGRVRVATDSDAALIRPILPPVVPIRVAPTPELDEVVGELEKALRSGGMEASYFDDGRLSEATLAKIFRAARDLFRRAPWKTAFDSHVLRLDVPELGVDGACLSILGALGETLGFVLFDSFADYEAFTEATAAREEAMEDQDRDFGAPWRILTYESASDIPEQMRREVKEHRWLLAGPRVYPFFRSHSRDGSSGSLDERETLLMAVAADALAAFARTHPAAFSDFDLEMPEFPELVMQHHGDGLPACTVTFPFESSAEFLDLPPG